ncbi:hypothetical protein PILCRDRAFT_365117 [Piloderma croceum F 1598]|uniref:HNH nuclease domain-containing protein n=1 Tax=Piloderma croceum (strain F 1598) TaxID=765440 RepID=A0A0C3G062_PILCF|nr:hypothetical protein PILCRDRAFT_365117 [Piloderma croceum F 1598]
MAGDSQASFSQSVRNRIRETYKHRCVICLAWIDTTQCAHVLDAATPGALQLRNAVTLGVLPKGYQKNALANGMVQCPNCHALFTKNRVVLSLPIPVLKYLEKYVRSTRKAVLKPLHEVRHVLR